MSRSSKDIYKLLSGELIALDQMTEPPEGSTIWNGYDYKNQCWVFNGERDTRSLEQLRSHCSRCGQQPHKVKTDCRYYGSGVGGMETDI